MEAPLTLSNAELLRLLEQARLALKSYQYGNNQPEMAIEMSKQIDKALGKGRS